MKIALIGMMGCGKTTIGKILSDKLNLKYHDTDDLVEKFENDTIKNIFESKGEEYFRKLETEALEYSCKFDNIIISTGGGIIKKKKNIDILKNNNCKIFYIYRSIDNIIESIDKEIRPLISNDKNKLYNIFEERKDLYIKYSDYLILNNNCIEETISLIIDNFNNKPKICVPLVFSNFSELAEEINFVKETQPDLIEWRGDYFESIEDMNLVTDALNILKDCKIPIIFTLRSYNEGGKKIISENIRKKIIETCLNTGYIKYLDTEVFNDNEEIRNIKELCKKNNTELILSYHNFTETPEKELLINKLKEEKTLGADICKIAVMPKEHNDVIKLLEACKNANEEKIETIVIAMGELGKTTRISSYIYGSVITFAKGMNSSAPGQISLNGLKRIYSL